MIKKENRANPKICAVLVLFDKAFSDLDGTEFKLFEPRYQSNHLNIKYPKSKSDIKNTKYSTPSISKLRLSHKIL